MIRDLSERQQRILHFLQDFIGVNRFPPTIREIGEKVGISSTSVVKYNLDALERKGFIERDRDISRGIRLIGEWAERVADLIQVPILNKTIPFEVTGKFGAGKVLVPGAGAIHKNHLQSEAPHVNGCGGPPVQPQHHPPDRGLLPHSEIQPCVRPDQPLHRSQTYGRSCLAGHP